MHEFRPIERYTESADDSIGRSTLKDIQSVWIKGERYTQEDVNRAADSLIQAADAYKLETGGDPILVFKLLNDEKMLNLHYFRTLGYEVHDEEVTEDTITLHYIEDGRAKMIVLDKSDITSTLKRVRSAIQERLRAQGRADMHLLAEDPEHKQNDHVNKLQSDYLYKLPGSIRMREMRQRLEAENVLYRLEERSPYLLYRETIIDPTFEAILERKIDFSTLDRWIQEEPLPALFEVLTHLREAILGLQFLIKYGLRLADLDPTNIGIRRGGQRTAFLFDYDGLRTDQQAILRFPAKTGFVAPERVLKRSFDPLMGEVKVVETKEDPITQDEMVYEMGVTFERMLAHYRSSKELASIHKIIPLLTLMHSEAPPRPTLDEIEKILREELEVLRK